VGDCVENYERFTDKIKTLKNLAWSSHKTELKSL
jgi:hypothetical protein